MKRSKHWTLAFAACIAAVYQLSGCTPATDAPENEPAADAGLERIDGHPNLNGIWQAAGTAHWNIEAHPAAAIEDFWQLGAIAAVPAGQSIVDGGTIPYLPEALAKRDDNRAGWPRSDPEASCYMPGVPRANYMPFPFQIVQGQRDILFVYEFASANRIVYMSDHQEPPVDSWMGWSNGHWEGDTLVIEVTGNNDRTWFDRAGNHHGAAMKVTERWSLIDENHLQYEATIEDPETFSRAWTLRVPLYRRIDPNMQLLEFKCVEFSEELLYGELKKQTDAEAE
jgi:hypothetical protein